jgi:predicted ATPase
MENSLLSKVMLSQSFLSESTGASPRSRQCEHTLHPKESNSLNLSHSKKFVGRDDQVQILSDCLKRVVSKQKIEIALLHGVSGSGKSSLVQEFMSNYRSSEVLCVQGKFDQRFSHTPYSALVSASDQLCRQIFRRQNSDEICERIRNSLCPDINLLGNLIPLLSNIDSSNIDSNHVKIQSEQGLQGKSFARFKLLFRIFFRSTASPENPLILFLDDLQWADKASLEVLECIINDPLAKSIMIICAYREGEMSKESLRTYLLVHESLTEMEYVSFSPDDAANSRTTITDIVLDCLDAFHINEIVAFKLGVTSSSTMSLSQLIWKKTGGNPFYTLNFLEMLYKHSLIRREKNGTWIWDQSQILRTTNVSDNLASILKSRLQCLHDQVRSILQIASFIGCEFPASILATILYEEQDIIAAEYTFRRQTKDVIYQWITSALEIGVEEGLLEKTTIDNHRYKFAHDAIQEVLYEILMPDETERLLLHQRISILIWDSVKDVKESKIDDWIIFLAADNINRAVSLADYSGDRYYLTELNLAAAKRLIDKSAFHLAAKYLRLAVDLLLESRTCWEERYDLCLDLFNTAAGTEKVVGCYTRCAKIVSEIHENAVLLHHRSDAFAIEMDSLDMQGNLKGAIVLGFSVLRQLGVKFPRRINVGVVAMELLKAKATFGRRKLRDLLSFPVITDGNKLLELLVMNAIALNAFLLGEAYKEIYAVVCLRMFRYTVKYGISKMHSPIAIVAWGSLNAVMGQFDVALESERLAFCLVDKYNLDSIRGTTIIGSYQFNHFWRTRLDSASRHEFLHVYQHAMSYGHIKIAQYGFYSWIVGAMYLDDLLTDINHKTRFVVSEMRALDSKSFFIFLLPSWQVVSPNAFLLYEVSPHQCT